MNSAGDGAATPEQIENQITELDLREQLDALDRQWTIQRENYMVKGRNGQKVVPNGDSATMQLILGAIVWIFLVVRGIFEFINGKNSEALFALLGVVVVTIGIAMLGFSINKANTYRDTETAYQKRRQELLDQINK